MQEQYKLNIKNIFKMYDFVTKNFCKNIVFI